MASCDDKVSPGQRWRFEDIVDEPMRMLPPIQGYENKPLVSLDEAIKPLLGQIMLLQQYVDEAKAKCNRMSDDELTLDESAAIFLYTMEWPKSNGSFYSVLNTHLRSEDRSSLKDWFSYMRLFLNGLVKIQSSSRRLFRGVKQNLAERYKLGENVIWWAFSSCTDDRSVAERFCGKVGPRTMLEIECYTGKSIATYSKYPSEKETLLIAARNMEVISNTTDPTGLTLIRLKETEPKFSLIVLPEVEQSKKATIPWSVSGQTLQFVKQRTNRQNIESVRRTIDDNTRCSRLEMRHCRFEPRSLEELGTMITESSSLTEVNLSHNHLSDGDVRFLSSKLSLNPTHTVKTVFCYCFRRTKVRKVKECLSAYHSHFLRTFARLGGTNWPDQDART